MSLTRKQEKLLKTLAHDRKPVIWLGQHGLTSNVLEEIENALEHHELIKIKLRVGERDTRNDIIDDICTVTGAEMIQKIGNTLTIYRQNKDSPVIKI